METEERSTSNPVSAESAWFDREVGWLRANGLAAHWIAYAILGALVVDLILIAALATGPINVFHNDAFLLLDDGWRVLNGQVPHRDFHTPLGPVEFWLVGAGMLLSHGRAQGIAIGIAGLGLLLGVWSWFLCRTRMPVLFASVVTAWIVLTATCPTPLGFDPRFLSCAMIYNRQGYALLGLILIECAFAREKSRFWGGFSSGAAVILLLFLKLNFLGIAALFLLVSIPLSRGELSRLRGFLTGAAVFLVAFLTYPRFSLSAFIEDMSFVTQARTSSLNIHGLLHAIEICAKSGNIWIVIAITTAMILVLSPRERASSQLRTLVLLGLIVLASGPLFLQTNALENRCQLASLWIIVLLDPISSMHLRIASHKLLTLVLMAASIGSIGAALAPEVASTVNLVAYHDSDRMAAGIRVAAPGTRDVNLYDSTDFYDKVPFGDGDGTHYAESLNDGIDLLRRQSDPNESILALGFYNPFPYLLRRIPARGGSAFLFVGNSISGNAMPPAEWVFDHADLMMLPTYEGTHKESDQFIQDYYRPYLAQNFHFVAKSQDWALYRRNR